MNTTAILTIVFYLVIVSVIGMLLARRTTSATQWTVGGGGMGLMMIAAGVAGTRIGGAGTYGVAGNVMSQGVWNMWWYAISTFLAMLIVGAFFAVPYRRMRLQTVGELFTMRFGSRRGQVLTSLCVQTEYFIINIIEAYIIGTILVGVTGMPMAVGVSIAAVVLVGYISLGGLWGAAVTNLIHCSVIVIGLVIIGVMGLNDLGGWAAVSERIDGHLAGAGKDAAAWWGFNGASFIPIVAMIFSVVIHTPAASVYTNFSTAAKNERILLPGFILAGLIGGLMPLLAGFVGILTLADFGYVKVAASYEYITRFAADLNPIVGGIALAAVLAAVISSGGPILLSSATMLVRDWLPFTSEYTSDGQLRAYRITTIIYGIVAAFFAWFFRTYTNVSMLQLLLFGFAMVVPPAIAVGYLLYWRRTTEKGAFWGMAVGYIAGMVWFGITEFAIRTGYEAGEGASSIAHTFEYFFVHEGKGIDPSYATTVVPFIAVPLISLLTKRNESGEDEFYAQLAAPQEDLK